MRCTVTALLVVALGLLLASPSPSEAKKKPRQIVAAGQSQFGLDMYKTMTEGTTDNIVFSPLSICSALAMTYAGSKGTTADELGEALHFSLRRSATMRAHRSLQRKIKRRYANDVTLHVTNRLYTSRRLKMRIRFSHYLKRMFDARVSQLAFGRPREAAEVINSRVSNDTAGNIDRLIEPQMLSRNTRLVMVNAVYFKGAWKTPFDRSATTPGQFHTLSAGARDVQMMVGRLPLAVGRVPSLRSRVLLIPYEGSSIHMVILLPARRDGIHQLERGLATTSLSEVFSRAKVGKDLVVKLPRFKLAERIDLKRVLQTMGIKDVFDPARADLSRISRTPGLYATDAIHKAVIEVNEEGTEASAATGITVGFRKHGSRPPPFVVDHPFFFALYDARSDLTLFLGRVMDPEQE